MIYNRPLKDYYVDYDSKNIGSYIPFLLGRNAINYVIESLSVKSILLPAFICPMVVDIFKHHKIEVFFYDALDKKLSIPIDAIVNELSKIKSNNQLFFLWHDYLGVVGDMPIEIYDYLSTNNIKVIIDATHSLPNEKYKSEVVIYGYRKLLNEPFGALLKMESDPGIIAKNNKPWLKLWIIFLVYKLKSNLLYTFGFFSNITIVSKILKRLSVIDKTLSFDSNNLFLIDSFKHNKILAKYKRLDYRKICSQRQKNFLRYAEKLSMPIGLDKNHISCPYGFPFFTKNSRALRKKLWDGNIHSFILWKDLHNDIPSKNKECAHFLSNSIIVLPVNHDLSSKDIDKVIEVVSG